MPWLQVGHWGAAGLLPDQHARSKGATAQPLPIARPGQAGPPVGGGGESPSRRKTTRVAHPHQVKNGKGREGRSPCILALPLPATALPARLLRVRGVHMVRPPPIGTPGQLPHGGNSAPAPALAASPWISERIGEPGVHFPPFCPRVVNNSADLFATQKGKMQAGKPLVCAR